MSLFVKICETESGSFYFDKGRHCFSNFSFNFSTVFHVFSFQIQGSDPTQHIPKKVFDSHIPQDLSSFSRLAIPIFAYLVGG